jgi:hypothetical protein
MTDWHIDDAAAAAYGRRQLGPVQRASLETHAVRCERCRARLVASSTASSPSAIGADRLWSRIESRVSSPTPGPVSRTLLRLGIREPDVVVLQSVAAQSRPWTIATTLVLVAAAVAAMLGPVDAAHDAFVLVAPLVPALGVAATYRLVPSGVDLVERAAPFSPARMLLWRTAYVVAAAVPLAVLAGVLVLPDPLMALAWLLPAAACTSCVAAAATWTDPVRPAAVVALVWAAVVISWSVRDTTGTITAIPTQAAAVAVVAAALAVLQRRLGDGAARTHATRSGRS